MFDMNFRIVVALHVLALVLVGCSMAKYPEPEPSVTNVKIVIRDNASAVVDDCSADAIACAYINNNPCIISMSSQTWEMTAVHELAHCLDVNDHD